MEITVHYVLSAWEEQTPNNKLHYGKGMTLDEVLALRKLLLDSGRKTRLVKITTQIIEEEL